METGNMVTRKTWKEFQDSHLLWWVNRTLHLFGWSIVLIMQEDGSITDAFPARVRFRGFIEEDNEEGFVELTNYIKENIDDLVEEANS